MTCNLTQRFLLQLSRDHVPELQVIVVQGLTELEGILAEIAIY